MLPLVDFFSDRSSHLYRVLRYRRRHLAFELSVKHVRDVVYVICLGDPGSQWRTQGSISGFVPPKLPKLDLTTDAAYFASLPNVNMYGRKRATVQYII